MDYLQNIFALSAFMLLAWWFGHWWISLFSVIFLLIPKD